MTGTPSPRLSMMRDLTLSVNFSVNGHLDRHVQISSLRENWRSPISSTVSELGNAPFTLKLCRTRLENLDCFLYGELVGELIPVGEVPMVDVKWEKKDVGEFKVPAIMSAVWLSDKGERRAFIVNISGEERRFEYKFAPNGETHSVTLPPRSVKDCKAW